MATTLLNSKETSDLLTLCRQYMDEMNQDKFGKCYLKSETNDFVNLWNKYLVSNLLNNKDFGQSFDNFAASSAASEKSFSLKEIELLKNIPQNMKQSTFFQELNRKMEIFVTENEKNSTNRSNTDKRFLFEEFEEINSPVITSYSNDTPINLSCTGKDQMKFEKNDKTSFSDICEHTKFSVNNLNLNNMPSYVTFFSLESQKFPKNEFKCFQHVFKSEFSFPNKLNKVGCDMEKATLFETDDSLENCTDEFKNSTELIEVYETNPTVGEIPDDCVNNEQIDYSNDVQDKPKTKKTDTDENIIDTVYETINRKCMTLSPTVSTLSNRSKIKSTNWKNKMPAVKNLSLKKYSDWKKRFKIKPGNVRKSVTSNKLQATDNQKKNCKKQTLSDGILAKKPEKYSKITKCSVNKCLSSINARDQENETSLDLLLNQCCFSNKYNVYIPSETSFPSSDKEEISLEGIENDSTVKFQMENQEKLKTIFNSNDLDLNNFSETVCVNVPLDLKKYGCISEKCDQSLQKNRMIKGIPVFPVDKEFRSFANFNSKFQMKEDIFEDFSKENNHLQQQNEEENEIENSLGNKYHFELEKLGSKTEICVKEGKYGGSYISHITGNEIVFESIVDVEANDEGQSVYSDKSSPEKLHETLLNNIYRSVSIKVKRAKTKKKFKTINRSENIFNANCCNKRNNGFELMLKFAIENMEEEYIKRDSTMNKVERHNLETKSEPIMKTEFETINIDTKEITREIVNKNEKKNELVENNSLSLSSENSFPTVKINGEIGEITWQDDSNGIRIYAIPEKPNFPVPMCTIADNVENDGIGIFQTFCDINSTKKNTADYSSEEEINELPRVKTKQSYYTAREDWETSSYTTTTHHPGSQIDVGQPTYQTTPTSRIQKLNVKMLNGKVIVFKTSSSEKQHFQMPSENKKTSFWGTMLKQTARIVPFFTFQGNRINLDTLGDAFSR